jgi:hypothetical protein
MSKVIKEKMEKLDTLSGGIVFGKEEAWERLQGKLDKKPVRKIALGYRIGVAAAAVLLLSVCIIALYNKQEEKIAAAPSLYQNEAAQSTPSIPAVIENAAGVVTNESKEVRTVKRTQRMPATVPVTITAITRPEPVVTHDMGVIDPPSPPVAIVPAVKPKMRVVHINEIDIEETETNVYAAARSNLKEMNVVNANEEWSGERDVIIQRSYRPHGTLPFFAAPGENNTSTNQRVSMAHSPFNVKLSIQN